MWTIGNRFLKHKFVARIWCSLCACFRRGFLWSHFSLVPWTECSLAAGPCSVCFWSASSTLIAPESLSSLWQFCSVKQSGISGDGWDPNEYANMDNLCLNLRPFQYSKSLVQIFSHLQIWIWWTLVSRKYVFQEGECVCSNFFHETTMRSTCIQLYLMKISLQTFSAVILQLKYPLLVSPQFKLVWWPWQW